MTMEIYEGPWHCFHCDRVFTDRESAEEHFGSRQSDAALCQADQFELTSVRKQRDQCELEILQLKRRLNDNGGVYS